MKHFCTRTVTNVTSQLLEDLVACQDGIDFFKRNKLEGFPVELINKITGEHNQFVRFVKYGICSDFTDFEIVNDLIHYKVLNREYTLDKNCNVLEIKNGKRWTKFTYNEFGKVLTYSNSSGLEQTFTYTPSGKELSYIDSFGCFRNFIYDENENLIECKSYDKGDSFKSTFDENNNEIYRIYGDGDWKKKWYNESGEVIKSENPFAVIEYTYDKSGKVEFIKNNNGCWEELIYNEAGLLIKYRDSNNYTYECTYDDHGNLLTTTENSTSYNYLYYSTGQLHKVLNDGKVILTIPKF